MLNCDVLNVKHYRFSVFVWLCCCCWLLFDGIIHWQNVRCLLYCRFRKRLLQLFVCSFIHRCAMFSSRNTFSSSSFFLLFFILFIYAIPVFQLASRHKRRSNRKSGTISNSANCVYWRISKQAKTRKKQHSQSNKKMSQCSMIIAII